MKYKRNLIHSGASIKDALKVIDEVGTTVSTLFIIDHDQKLLGTLTDGDIRRGLIKGMSVDALVDEIMNTGFKFISTDELTNYTGRLLELRKKDIRFVPVLSAAGTLMEIIDLESVHDILPVDAFILAGGRGERLLPVTRTLPKPLIEVGGKPILGHNISWLVSFGINNIYISVNYLADQIESYFGKGDTYQATINYTREDKPLGTIGSLALNADDLKREVLVMNSDLLTNIDFSDFYRSFKKSGADMAVVVKPFYQDFPYAIIETDENNFVQRLQEKPRYTYYTNAGIYLLSQKVVKQIVKGQALDATDLMEKVIASGMKVYSYPIINYWLDIGKPEDLRKANEDIKHLHI